MTYDALLALRGWGEPEFRTVTPEFQSAVRFALFAEAMAPELIMERAVQARPIAGMKGPEFEALAKAKATAKSRIPHLEALLTPADE